LLPTATHSPPLFIDILEIDDSEI